MDGQLETDLTGRRKSGLPDPGLLVSKAGHFRGPRQLPQKDVLKKPKRPGSSSEGAILGGRPGHRAYEGPAVGWGTCVLNRRNILR